MYRTLCTTNSTNIMLMLVFYFVAVRIQDKPNAEPIRRDFIQYVFRRQSNRDCRIQTAKQSDGKNGLTKIFNKWFSEMILELFFFLTTVSLKLYPAVSSFLYRVFVHCIVGENTTRSSALKNKCHLSVHTLFWCSAQN